LIIVQKVSAVQKVQDVVLNAEQTFGINLNHLSKNLFNPPFKRWVEKIILIAPLFLQKNFLG
jgi:hypothetical protein